MTRPDVSVREHLGRVGCFALIATALIAPARSGAQTTPAVDTPRPEPAASEPARPEPEFKPGISGLKMADVREHKHLWRDLDELATWEQGDRLSVAEYRAKAIEKTARYLGFTGAAAERFSSAASAAVASVRESFRRDQGGQPGEMESRFSAELGSIVARLTAQLGSEPRQQLFAPNYKKWLLQLAFGPSEQKEAREAKRAQPAPSAEPSQTDKSGKS